MEQESREVSPFNLDKSHRSNAPKQKTNNPDRPPVAPPEKVREISPIMFTRPGEDVYVSDDPDASPIYSDFRPSIFPSDSDIETPGEEVGVPKDLSVQASATSSPPYGPEDDPEKTVQQSPKMEDADKDNGQPKESESSTPTSSSTENQNSGKSEPPA